MRGGFLWTLVFMIGLAGSAPARAVETTGNFHTASPASSGGIVEALRLADKGRWSDAARVASRLKTQAGKDTYDWFAYKQGAPGNNFADISEFVNNHPDWPLMDKIRLEAERVMPSGMDPQRVIKWFSENPPATTNGMEIYIQALTRTGQANEISKVVQAWWETASITRDQQKQFFSKYERYLDKDSHRVRLDALISRGQYSQAHGVAALLGPGYQALAEARVALANGEGNVNGYLNRVPSNLQNDEGLLYERLRWRRKADMDSGALEILGKEPAFGAKHDPEAWWTERQIMARRLIEKGNYTQAYALSKNHRQKEGLPFAEAEWLSGWIALEHLNRPWDAFEHFERMYHKVETPISRARGAYWAGRASERLKHPEIAQKWYKVAAKENGTFYGQMAGAALGLDPSLGKTFSGDNKSALNSFTAMVQAVEWFDDAGMRAEASSFLYRMGKLSETKEQFAAVASLAEKMKYRHVSIKVSQDAAQAHGVALIDTAYPSITEHLGSTKDVEWALVHALIRQESRFDFQALSPVGARGLMQVMPGTAKDVARKLGISHQTEWLITRPDHNIKLGTRYIAQMLDQFGNNYALAAAAYNAGPGRVNKWIKVYGDPRTGEIDLVNWIESIPFSETRNYVQRVLEGVYVYRLKLKGKQKDVNIPIHVALNER